MSLENSLREAVRDNEFELFFQPKLCVETNNISSAEVFIRWCRNGEEWVVPEELLPITEAIGLMPTLGDWILEKACETTQTWQRNGFENISIAINISERQLPHENFLKNFTKIVKSSKFPAKYSELEIAQSILVQDLNFIEHTLTEIKGMGIKIGIDNFGLSSFASLNQLPVDYIKIDKHIIHDISSKEKASEKAIITLAKVLRFSVVAEGVESLAQFGKLKNWGGDFFQGYYIARPVNATNFIAFLNSHHQNKT